MAEVTSELHFSANTKTSELWKSVSSVIMNVVDEAHFEASNEGLRFRSMDPSHVALVDISCPAIAFEKYECDTPVKFGFRVDDFAKVIKRAGSEDSIELSLQESMLNVKTTGGYTRNYKLKLIESSGGSSTPLPKLTFDAKLVMAPAILDRILSDIQVVADRVMIETTNDKQAIFSTDSERGEAKVVLDDKSNIENLKEISVTTPSKANFSTEFIAKVVKAIGESSESVTAEYAANKPLKLTFALPNAVRIEFFMAPRVLD